VHIMVCMAFFGDVIGDLNFARPVGTPEL
jgi:hypothetical protein